MSRTALAVSPHLDDAAFSCGGTLATLARAGWQVVLATLFTRSVDDPRGFALACQLDKGFGAEVDYMALRRAEDGAAAAALGLQAPVHVPLPEAPHRGYDTAAALFGPLRPDDAVADDLRRAVLDLVAAHAPDLILAPQAIGGHVDHRQTVRALEGVPQPILWWRDFPYVAREAAPAEPFGTRMAALPVWTSVLDEAAQATRLRACAAYGSQLGFQFGGLEGLRARLAAAGPAEGFRLEGALDILP